MGVCSSIAVSQQACKSLLAKMSVAVQAAGIQEKGRALAKLVLQ
jgi:hypothetical protein